MTELSTKIFVLVVFMCVVVKALDSLSGESLGIQQKYKYDEDADLSPRALITKYGYRGETHKVPTADGYVLEMHRITGPKGNADPKGKQPVLLMHGILSSSVDWIITGPHRAFGYALADEGYDVWLGNVRGNKFSRKHKKYTVIDKEFWQFSWHEIGLNDLPAMIDYVLENTGRKDLIYAGHSQGTTDFWVMASELPDYQKKVKAMFALAPVAYLTYIQSPFYRYMSKFGSSVEVIMGLLGQYEFEPTTSVIKEVTSLACDPDAWSQPMCTNLIFLFAGASSDQMNETTLPAILGHVPAGASVKQVMHYAQAIKANRFQRYDYGLKGNLMEYKRPKPPAYELSNIKVPVYLHYSSADMFASPRDVFRLHEELGNSVGLFRVPHNQFAHLDFTWAEDGKKLLYNEIIRQMNEHKS